MCCVLCAACSELAVLQAGEFVKAGLDTVVIEKSNHIGGCWRTQANVHSHVTVCEASFRLPMDYSLTGLPSPYTPAPEILELASRFTHEAGVAECIRFGSTVQQIQYNDLTSSE